MPDWRCGMAEGRGPESRRVGDDAPRAAIRVCSASAEVAAFPILRVSRWNAVACVRSRGHTQRRAEREGRAPLGRSFDRDGLLVGASGERPDWHKARAKADPGAGRGRDRVEGRALTRRREAAGFFAGSQATD